VAPVKAFEIDSLTSQLMKLKIPLLLIPFAAVFAVGQLSSTSFAAEAKKVEIFSWWTSGGEAAALDALLSVYKSDNPGVEVINAAVAGGAGSAAKPILQTRLAGGNPPDSWQSHVGSELLNQYVVAGYCVPINDLYESQGWTKVMPKGLIDQVSKNGQIYAVPAGVHRGNVLWYSKPVLAKAGIKVGDKLTSDEFLADLAKLKAAGIAALAVGDTQIWATTQLFENTLLSVVGPEGWLDLLSGKLTWDSPKVKAAAQLYSKELDYQNAEHSSLTWDQAVKLVIEGKAGFSTMGDWAYGEFAKAGQKPNVDFGWVAFPGTDGSFISIVDSFTLAKGAPDKN
jgi:glucose/mannose transport system substrate-binding protein